MSHIEVGEIQPDQVYEYPIDWMDSLYIIFVIVAVIKIFKNLMS